MQNHCFMIGTVLIEKKGSSTILSRTSIINGNFFDDVHFLSQFFPKCNT